MWEFNSASSETDRKSLGKNKNSKKEYLNDLVLIDTYRRIDSTTMEYILPSSTHVTIYKIWLYTVSLGKIWLNSND